MMAFCHWLDQRRLQFQAELCALSLDRTKPVDAIRIKAGHLECSQLVIQAFAELYNGDLTKFMQDYLGQAPEEEESDGPS